MAQKRVTAKRGARARRPAKPAGERTSYHGHEIYIPADDSGRRVVIDGVPIRYGETADGYYLSVYAFDRDRPLLDVVKRYVDYRDAVLKRRETGGSQ